MLDDNLRILGRRVNDLELELTEKKEKLSQLERERRDLSEKLAIIYKEQESLRQDVEDELRYKLDEKDREIRKHKEDLQVQENKFIGEMESYKIKSKYDLDKLHEKIQIAMDTKKEQLAQLAEQLRLKETEVNKLKELLEKQRRDLYK